MHGVAAMTAFQTLRAAHLPKPSLPASEVTLVSFSEPLTGDTVVPASRNQGCWPYKYGTPSSVTLNSPARRKPNGCVDLSGATHGNITIYRVDSDGWALLGAHSCEKRKQGDRSHGKDVWITPRTQVQQAGRPTAGPNTCSRCCHSG